jgi:hypothetical protein
VGVGVQVLEPFDEAPNQATTWSMLLSSISSTVSPGPTPRPRSAAAARVDRPRSSP